MVITENELHFLKPSLIFDIYSNEEQIKKALESLF